MLLLSKQSLLRRNLLLTFYLFRNNGFRFLQKVYLSPTKGSNLLNRGCITEAEHTPHNQEVVGSKPATLHFQENVGSNHAFC